MKLMGAAQSSIRVGELLRSLVNLAICQCSGPIACFLVSIHSFINLKFSPFAIHTLGAITFFIF
jgi:hypothetical protein